MADKNELDILEREAVALETQDPDPGNPGEIPPAPPSPADEWTGLIKLVVMVVAPVFPFVPHIYDEATCGRIGAALAQLAAKYGWDLGGVTEKWGPEIALVIAVAPTLVPLRMGYLEHKQATEAMARAVIEKAREKAQESQQLAATTTPDTAAMDAAFGGFNLNPAPAEVEPS
ncbi:MAG TPA: hypothetical protein VFF03_15025 [Rhodocyclaceae bacterium]|nr:hypothetical protein [Rhodocyclaceae bacterium]